jgi:hypothetical protein
MEGAALAEKKRFDLAIVTAWHTAVFALNGYAGKLKGKSLSDFLTDKPSRPASHAQGLAFFHRLKAKGVPVEITRH